jgi:hypothetical protein
MHRILKQFLLPVLVLKGMSATAQLMSTDAIQQSFDTYRQQVLQEKLFLHLDQPSHFTGETVWFKINYVDATFHKPLSISKVAYVELLGQDHKPVLQTKVSLSAEGGIGSLFLPASILSGNYVLRAYTSWMRNFSPAYFFEQPLTIINPFKPLDPPIAQEKPSYSVQLFPEGGNLVKGLPANVAFKVTDPAGKGVDAQGWLLGPGNDTLAQFSTFKFGIGTFSFTPASTDTYRVVIRPNRGQSITQAMPTIYADGYTMRVDDSGSDQLKITVNTTAKTATSVYLFAHTRQTVKKAEMRPLQGETLFLLDKKALGDGVSHITLFDANRQPVCERLYFKRPTDTLAIQLGTTLKQYPHRSKITLDATVNASTTAQADLSVAVYRIDSLSSFRPKDIVSYLWLTSDLQGAVESPTYYFQPETSEIRRATDNLMLTHGWRRFKWETILTSQGNNALAGFQFLPDYNGLLIRGRITNPAVNNAPVPGVTAYLSSPGKPVRLFFAKSDSKGRLLFETLDFYGAKTVYAQTNPADSLYKLTIDNPFSEQPPTSQVPTLMLTEQNTSAIEERSVAMQVQNNFWGNQSLRYRYPAVDSAGFYGKPSETYMLDAYTRFPTMEDVLREYVLGVMPRKRQGRFHFVVPNAPYRELFSENPLVMIDGIPVFNIDKVMAFSPLKIQKLDVTTNRYFVGSTIYNGIVSFMTYKGDLAGFSLDDRLVKVDYDGLQLQREFFAPRYVTTQQQTSRLPDARTLLYWNPSLRTNAQGKGQIDFYSSDISGRYLIEVNGINQDGKAGTQRGFFEVQKTE